MVEATLTKLTNFPSTGWKTISCALAGTNPYLLAWGLGLLVSLAFAPFHAWFVLPFAFSGFLWLFGSQTSSTKAFWLGWFFGFGSFLGGMYWLGNGPKILGIWLAVPFATVGIPLFLSFFPATATYLTFRCSSNTSSRVFFFTAFWSLFEWLRGHILTGLPWNLMGYTWDGPLLQTTSLVGIYGLTLLTLFGACVFATRHKIWIATTLISLIGLAIWGDYRLTQGPTIETATNLRIVQASIPQQTKWLVEHFQQNFDRYIALSHLEAEKPLSAIIWPESSVPTLVEQSPPLLEALGIAAPPGGVLFFGAPRKDHENLKTSILIVNDKGVIIEAYDKSHLVPFGEYVPLRSLIPFKGLRDIISAVAGDHDYTPGTGIRTLTLPPLPSVSPLICYEAIFPNAVIDPKDRAHWMLNITNDAWFGHSSGPYQHLQSVRVRAIEEGIPLVRSANNGISAVIDPYGRILHRLELDEIGFIDFALPQRLETSTPYHRWGDLPFAAMVLVFMLLGALYRRQDNIQS